MPACEKRSGAKFIQPTLRSRVLPRWPEVSCRHGFSKRSATFRHRKVAVPKIGASGSLLIANDHLESFMPARCWIAPEMPTAVVAGGNDLAGSTNLVAR